MNKILFLIVLLCAAPVWAEDPAEEVFDQKIIDVALSQVGVVKQVDLGSDQVLSGRGEPAVIGRPHVSAEPGQDADVVTDRTGAIVQADLAATASWHPDRAEARQQ